MIATLFAVGVALIHVYIFYLESLKWGESRTNQLFGINDIQAQASQLMAFNQGFYNLFIALGILAGVAFRVIGHPDYGIALIDFSCLFALGAGLVLFFSRPVLAKAATIQAFPAFGYLGFHFLGY